MTQQFMLNKRKPKTNPLNKYILPDTVNKAGNKKKKFMPQGDYFYSVNQMTKKVTIQL